jgi:hypothetical protein
MPGLSLDLDFQPELPIIYCQSTVATVMPLLNFQSIIVQEVLSD